MKYIVAFLEVDTAEDFDASVADVTNAVTENRQYLKRVCAKIRDTHEALGRDPEVYNKDSRQVIILYSYKPPEMYKVFFWKRLWRCFAYFIYLWIHNLLHVYNQIEIYFTYVLYI